MLLTDQRTALGRGSCLVLHHPPDLKFINRWPHLHPNWFASLLLSPSVSHQHIHPYLTHSFSPSSIFYPRHCTLANSICPPPYRTILLTNSLFVHKHFLPPTALPHISSQLHFISQNKLTTHPRTTTCQSQRSFCKKPSCPFPSYLIACPLYCSIPLFSSPSIPPLIGTSPFLIGCLTLTRTNLHSMTVFRPSMSKPERKLEPTATLPWRNSREPTVGTLSSVSVSSSSTTKAGPFTLQIFLTIILTVYLLLPSHVIQSVSKQATSTSIAGTRRKMLDAVSNVVNIFPSVSSHRKGVSIVAACMNRHETLAKVLPTWLAVRGVDEIVIVDWTSDPPLRSIVNLEQDSRLSLYRVNKESSWVLSRAYNVALNSTKCDYVIRTDCDYSLKPNILDAHNLSNTEKGFYSGNWLLARNENEVHLNGAMVMKRSEFWSVGGYDERIQTYGWDDEDLYIRLASKNMTKFNISYDHVNHFQHGDEKRAQTGVKFPQVQIDINQLLLERLPQWSHFNAFGNESSQYRLVSKDKNGYHELESIHAPKSLKDWVSEAEYQESWCLALGRRLADEYHIPWDVLESMESSIREALLRSLKTLQNELDDLRRKEDGTMIFAGKVVPLPTQARVLFVHCMHGLGNRLRALGSALAFSKNTKRVPVVIWESDFHLSANFESLFLPSGFIVLNELKPKWPFKDMQLFDPSWNHFKHYNYMEMEKGAKKGELIRNPVDKHIYYKGAYSMESPQYTWWEVDNQELRKLRPIAMVEGYLQSLRKQGLSSAIGVHIRNRTLSTDIKDVDFNVEYGRKAVESMQHWRRQSCYVTFIGEMERIIREEDINAKFYVASDSVEVVRNIEKRFPGKVMSTSRSCDERDSHCLKYAVVDMYALSRTKSLLGSNWSSYTEMAERLGGRKARLAGQDFGLQVETVENTIKEPELAIDRSDRMVDASREH